MTLFINLDYLKQEYVKKSRVDSKGRCVLPQKLRRKLDLNGKSSILWMCINRKNGRDNEFLIEVEVKK